MTTTIECLTAFFGQVADQLAGLPQPPEAHRWPREVGPLGLLHAFQGGGNRAVSRWLTRASRALCPRVPERPRLLRLCTTHHDGPPAFVAAPPVRGGMAPSGIELIHPMRAGRRPPPLGRKGLSNHRGIGGGTLGL